MNALFITATGTDIGKTYVSALLVKRMRELGMVCGYYKPVMSGDDGTSLSDCEYVVKMSGLDIEPAVCTSYRFTDAVSPHLAARREGITIEKDKILSDYKTLANKYDYMIIEGAGGVTCPIIEDKYLMWNLIKDLGTAAVIVADGGLGTINSVITTVVYLQNRAIEIKGIILNNYDSSDYMHIDNLAMIEKMTGIDVIATIEKDSKEINISPQELKQLFL